MRKFETCHDTPIQMYDTFTMASKRLDNCNKQIKPGFGNGGGGEGLESDQISAKKKKEKQKTKEKEKHFSKKTVAHMQHNFLKWTKEWKK